MEITGINAVKHETFVVDETTGVLDFDDETGAELVWGWNANVEGFTSLQVRDILIKFANSKNAMRRDMTAEQIVDEFMVSDGE